MKKLEYLINYLLEENKDIKVTRIPYDEKDKKILYRSLCNIRKPNKISNEYLEIENEYLQEELNLKKITQIEDIELVNETIPNNNLKYKDKICLWNGDITTLKIDAIVNAANSQGLGCFVPCHKCIDNQINSNSGISLRLECDKIMKEKDYCLNTGETFITKAYNLPAKYVIHTVGPIIYNEVTKIEEEQLANCYINSLKLALKHGIKNIAFPCISTGEYRFPKNQASKIAISTVEKFLEEHTKEFERIIFNVYGEEDYEIYEQNFK